MNCKFTNVNKVDMTLVDKLVQFIPSVYQSMITKSYEDASRIDIIRQEEDEELKREICTKAKKISQSEGFRYFKILYSKLMNFLRLVANSKAYFKELINYDEFILILLESLSFDDTYISYQASQILASLISYKNNTAVKQEKLNKEKLLSPNLDLIGHIKKLLQKCDKLAEINPNDLRVLEINGAFLLLLLLIRDNKVTGQHEGTDSFDKFIADAILGEDKALFHYLDKLALKGLFSVSYGATVLINRALEYYQKSAIDADKKTEETSKYYIMNYSVQFIWNIYMIMQCSFEEQVDESLSLVSNLLHRNKTAVRLIAKMFPQSLFYKVEGADELFKQYSWGRWEWEQFFAKLKGNYNTATEQWNKQTRNELYDYILKEVDNYTNTQKEFSHNRHQHEELLTSKHSIYGYVKTEVKYLRWNIDEFEIEYPSHKHL